MFTKYPCALLVVPSNDRRDRHDIVAEILETARGGALKTHIMYKAKLNYGQACEYISLLVGKGFLENCPVEESRRMKNLLKTTEHGEKLLDNIKSTNLIWSVSSNPEKTTWLAFHDKDRARY